MTDYGNSNCASRTAHLANVMRVKYFVTVSMVTVNEQDDHEVRIESSDFHSWRHEYRTGRFFYRQAAKELSNATFRYGDQRVWLRNCPRNRRFKERSASTRTHGEKHAVR